MDAFPPRPFRRALSAAPFPPRLSGSLALLLLGVSPGHAAPVPWDANAQGAVVTALCADPQGRVDVATEGHGVWRYDPATHQYAHFTQKDGLGSDDVYALAVDAKGRLWAGTRHGLSVYNGQSWKTYGPLEGVGGWRTFALAACPADGDIWAATEGGLTRYSLHHDTWTQYSRLDGLPSDAISCLAFNRRGDLYVGAQADGLALASARNDYRTWRVVPGPAQPPPMSGGAGLPTALINCLLVTNSGAVYAGTDDGLARSEDGGTHWRFLRGADWKAKVDGQAAGLVDNADVRALEVLPVGDPQEPPIRIHAGGGAVGGYQADTDFDGGSTFTAGAPVDTSAIPAPAPADAYRTARWGSFTYTVPRLHPGGQYRVRLHFAEVAYTGPGQRVFNVTLNGKPLLTKFDIFAEAGGKNKAIVREFTAQADAQGRLTLAFQGAAPLPSHENALALLEDYVTCLAGDGAGHLLVGHRQQGLEAVSLRTGDRLFPGADGAEPTDFVTSLLPRPNGPVLIGGYGGGLIQRPLPGLPTAASTRAASTPEACPPLPTPAGLPTLAELNAMLKVVSAVPPDPQEMRPYVAALDDDWRTQGDWLGRYGRYWACLCAMASPHNYYWGGGWELVRCATLLGPNRTSGDALRYWVQWLYTKDPRSLELPSVYLDTRVQRKLTTWDDNRREAEVDDHGETYPMAMDGPHVYATLTVPPGLYFLSLYDMNKDGHDGSNRFRDYRVSVRPHPAGKPLGDLGGFADQPEWAHTRIAGFWGGVWKRFLVRGPATLTVEVNRNHSLNTILPAVMLDLVDEDPPPYWGTPERRLAWRNAQRRRLLAQWRNAGGSHSSPAVHTKAQAASELFNVLQGLQFTNGAWRAVHGRRFYGALLRWYAAQARSASTDKGLLSCLGTCYYQMGLYPEWEDCQRRAGLTPARDIEQALRWDGINGEQHGFEAVTAYVATHSGVVQSEQASLPSRTSAEGSTKGGGRQRLPHP